MSKFTKGKWSVEYGIDIKSDIRKDAYIAQLFFLGERFEEQAANGRLIAAAPEMYEELIFAMAALRDGDVCDKKRADKIEALLARIDGDSQEN